MTETNFAVNLRRLLLFEHRTAKEAAAALGVTEATVSRWLTGKRYPSAEALIVIDKLYGVSPRELDNDPVEFAQRLADPERMGYAAQVREHMARNVTRRAARMVDVRKDPVITELARDVQEGKRRKKQQERVVPLRRPK